MYGKSFLWHYKILLICVCILFHISKSLYVDKYTKYYNTNFSLKICRVDIIISACRKFQQIKKYDLSKKKCQSKNDTYEMMGSSFRVKKMFMEKNTIIINSKDFSLHSESKIGSLFDLLSK